MSKQIMFKNIRTKIWIYPSETAAWHFVTIPKKESAAIQKCQERKSRRGWGSIPVEAIIGKTTWDTSVFPDKRSGCYLLPVKLSVRQKEEIGDGDVVTLNLTIRNSEKKVL